MKLSELPAGRSAYIVTIKGRASFRKRMLDMGFVKNQRVEAVLNAPLKDPMKYKLMGYEVSLRQSEAELVEISIEEAIPEPPSPNTHAETIKHEWHSAEREIHVAFVGNPNAGKTSIFNLLTGRHEHVGNYSGVTVDAKTATFPYKGYKFRCVDLPGTYSLSTYSPEELYVRDYVSREVPDIVINVVDASNLERNLYLTTQLIDMDTYMVMALNMYDELEGNGDKLDHQYLSRLLGIPIVPTSAKKKEGLRLLLDTVISAYENREPYLRHIHINYGEPLESAISVLTSEMNERSNLSGNVSKRYTAITLLENDSQTVEFINGLPNGDRLLELRNDQAGVISKQLHDEATTAFADTRYGFIAGALAETFRRNPHKQPSLASLLDPILTHKFLGYPIFLLFMFITFYATFTLGQYPQGWIESGFELLGEWVGDIMPDGTLKDLLVDGIIAGIGGVIVFLPNILILYFFISVMEDSGYMARAAFIMDKLMHKMGLHGKSFIPLIMGFGCGVPAIMATRTIESQRNRIITILIIPFMSCTARLPVFLLLAGTFFPESPTLVLCGLYLAGVVVGIVTAKLLSRFAPLAPELPFVMELPPYRRPTTISVLKHLWQKAVQYLKKMGGVILLASIIIWGLAYFPINSDMQAEYEVQIAEAVAVADTSRAMELEQEYQLMHQEQSVLGQVGKVIQPTLAPFGFDWQTSICLLTGLAAKETVISTMAILYPNGSLPMYSSATVLALMVFILLYFPCIATLVAIKHETKSVWWMVFALCYSTVVAYLMSLLVYGLGSLIGG